MAKMPRRLNLFVKVSEPKFKDGRVTVEVRPRRWLSALSGLLGKLSRV